VGDVFRTGAIVGERVRLRVGGRTVAEGDLVDVEGEVGVRLVRVVE
jgi:flagellar motor switch/type III secretory pathway protein FliN